MHSEIIREDNDLTVTIFDSMAAAEASWRRLEATALFTPYQRYDWLQPLLGARGLRGARCAIAVVQEGDIPIALLPLTIENRFGIAVAGLLGADVGNVGWLPVMPAAARRLTPGSLDAILGEIRRQAGPLDILALHALPQHWLGFENPLLRYPHQPAPDHFYGVSIGPGAAAHRLNAKRIRNILRGKRRLEEAIGPVVLRAAATPDEIDSVHAAFLEQRGARFAKLGIRNVFSEDWFVAFFRDAAINSLGSDRPALRFHALYAGGEIVATSCGTFCGTHYSQYINSTSEGPAARYSLMGLLMYELTEELAAEGITSVDMGLGDFDYKTDWTDRQTVYDAVIPLTRKGRLAAPLLLGLRRLKRAIKQNHALFGIFKRVRAVLNRKD